MFTDPYREASELAKQGKHAEGWKIINRLLTENPLDGRALVTGSYIMHLLGGYPQAYHLARSATQVLPEDSAGWTNLGHVASSMWLTDEAERSYKRALKCARDKEHQKCLWINLSALYIDTGRFKEALALTDKILAIDPAHHDGLANQGFCRLALRDWRGWKGYHHTIGSEWRKKVQYTGEPEWDGSPGKTVVLYGDQGLGDEISFASMVPDAIDICNKVIIDCDARLEGLFRRSFPKARVYGTRTAQEGQWAKEDWQIDASLPLGQIGEFFRTTDESFPGTPYLTPDPDRVSMWKGLFAQKRKPVIGIAWTGGVPKTNSRNRRLGLKDFLPVFNAVDAHYVSLQYKDASTDLSAFHSECPGVDLKQYGFATLSNDYDDTAALIAACDQILCIQTAVAHTAGALGVPVIVLLPVATQWRYGDSHDSIPWYKSLRVIRQQRSGNWQQEILRAAKLLADIPRIPGAAGSDAREGGLRLGLDSLRADHLIDHKPYESKPSSGLRLRSDVQFGQELESGP